ncbi:hypothetical protein QR680_013274 [Steinernema hermaphroditum]|uniref:N-acetyllactosaminide beta-1,3-N-acetylglucosaminyltransferase n=1 Tax=Steinernema hermaphroditum TaxID=289476 RepID=A0AA39I7R6_9BILA|nr:hypothetical protein QR680_013274 [Steinernema hermaphroditum]
MIVSRRSGAICALGVLLLLALCSLRKSHRRRVRKTKEDFCFQRNVVASELSGEDDEQRVTLVLHSSFDRVGPNLLLQVKNWDGPISLAVVFPESVGARTTEELVACTAGKLRSLRESEDAIRRRLSVHFLVPRQKKVCPKCEIEPRTGKECRLLLGLSQYRTVDDLLDYPVNVARNMARKMVRSKYMVLADLDHLFSAHFEEKMARLAKRKLSENPKLALVYRIFEMADDVKKLPGSKADLRALFEARRAFVFHHQWHGHHIKHLDAWFEAEEGGPEEQPSVQFVQPYNVTDWEPQFVSLTAIPEHDETFSYPAADNTVLRWEMCRAGFEFAVVHDVFMFHLGIKRRAEQNRVEQARFRLKETTRAVKKAFVKRMADEHPETSGKCGF